MSNVLRVAVSNVRMPRSHRMTSVLPPLRTYSADSSHSSIVAEMPRLSSTGLRACPSSRSSVKFCMLRAPTWKMSEYLSISSIWLTSITSETSFRFSAFAASRSSRSPSSPSPWKLYGELRGLNAPPRRIFAPARLHRRRRRAHLRLGLRRARAGHDDHLVAADAHVADGDDGALGLERPARELVRLGDPQHLVHAVEQLDQRRVGMPLARRRRAPSA